MKATASKLRENIYRLLDQVVETRVPVEIERRGRRLEIVLADEPVRAELDRLEPRPDAIMGDRRVVASAREVTWARDPFDRVVVGHALAAGSGLLTKDRSIRRRFRGAFW